MEGDPGGSTPLGGGLGVIDRLEGDPGGSTPLGGGPWGFNPSWRGTLGVQLPLEGDPGGSTPLGGGPWGFNPSFAGPSDISDFKTDTLVATLHVVTESGTGLPGVSVL